MTRPQSGGKIVRPRRTAVFRTPYDRPTPRDPSQQNPSWISKLVYKPARIIASGAGKIISSVVFSESSSSSSEDEDSSSGMHPLDLVNAQESTFHKLSSKRVIEQLLMQETFAREEGDRLIDIIKERVSVPTSNEGMHNGLTNDVNVGEMSSKAVMEAKRWLEEKKSANGAGSPVDVAKSYMRARLPWGSPSANNSIQSFGHHHQQGHHFLIVLEPYPLPYSSGTLSSSKEQWLSQSYLKRRSRSNPSWNIQDEIRKVRAKATEEMLKNCIPHPPYVLPNSTIPTSEQNQVPSTTLYIICLYNKKELCMFIFFFFKIPSCVKTTEANQAVEDTNTAPQSISIFLSFSTVFDSGTGLDDSNGDTTIGNSLDFSNSFCLLCWLLEQIWTTGSFCIPKDVFETSKEADEIGAARG
ncbi:hypothetical protein HID58_013044, partial [Brassica napus]